MVVNARDAMPEGGTLTIATRLVAADESFVKVHPDLRSGVNYAVVAISDTGDGIDEQVKQHLFEPFFTTKEQGKGTGLGLAGAYGTAKSHGGSIEVVSLEGHGSTFSLYFPLSSETLKIAEHPPAPPAGGPGENILLIDDEKVVLRAEELALQKQGYTVSAFNDPVAAVAYFETHASEISCVILDIVMPKMNGKECYARIRAVSPSVKVIITTGYTSDPEFDAFVARNNLSVIAKPFDAEKLLEAIHTVLHG
jgi:CheY-like chemotaxis protein